VTVSLPYALAVWRRNLALYRRTWKLNLLPNFFEPLLYLVSVGVGVGAYISEMGGTSYVAFLAPGLVAVAAMNGASFEVTYNAFVRMNFEKTYESMLTTPIQPEDVLAGEVLWAVTRALIYGGIFWLVVAALGLAPLPWSMLAIPLIPLTGLLDHRLRAPGDPEATPEPERRDLPRAPTILRRTCRARPEFEAQSSPPARPAANRSRSPPCPPSAGRRHA